MEYINQKKLIYQYGLLTGLIAVIFEVMRFILQIHYSNDGTTTLVSLSILFGGILAGCLAVKKDNNGFISLSKTLKSGVGIALVYTIISIIYTLLLVNVLEPTFWDTSAQIAYEAAKEQNPEAMGNVSYDDFKPYFEWITYGVYPIIIAFSLFFGFIFSLVIGMVIKKSE